VEIGTACVRTGPGCLRERFGAAGLSGGEGVFVYGDDPVSVGRLFWLLEWAGAREVRVLDGGFGAWGAAGFPTEAGPAARRAKTFRPSAASGTATVDRAAVARGFGTAEMELVDLRGADTWSSPEGHVPHSLPYDFLALFDDASRWPDPATARAVFSRLGPRPTTYVDMQATFVLYGDGPADPRPGLGYLMLRAMDVDVAVYPGGWSDWHRVEPGAKALPVVRIVGALDLVRRMESANPGLTADRPAGDVVLFDVRTAPDHRVGHLPGALSLPAQFCDGGITDAVPAPPDGDRFGITVGFYCYGADCVRSRECSTRAAREGFRDVLWFRGGVPEWRAAGLPLPRSGRETSPTKTP
jgi:thiosulfate/3-mercaptopyruvate sulfurtransferase